MINPQALETFGRYDKKSLMAGIVVGQGLKGRARAPQTSAPAGFPQELWDAASERANAMIASMQVEQQSPGTPEETTPDDWEFDKDAFCFGIAAGRSLEGWEIDGGIKFNRSIRYYICLDSPFMVVIWLSGVTGNGENLLIDWGDSTAENSTNIDYADHHYINTKYRVYSNGSFYDIGYVTHNYENSGEYVVTIISTDNIAPSNNVLIDTFLNLGGVHEYGLDGDVEIPGGIISPDGSITGGWIVPPSSHILRAAYLYNIERTGGYAFMYLTGLSSVTIAPDNMAFHFGFGSFYGCGSLQNIKIPYGTTSLEGGSSNSIYGLFAMCRTLTNINIPNSVVDIGTKTFSDCTMLEGITIPDSVTRIGYGAFNSCESLTSVTIPNGVTSIQDFTFDHCSSLTNITIPDSVTKIGYRAFDYCSSLTSINIPISVTSIDRHAFGYPYSYNSFHLSDIYFAGSQQQWETFGVAVLPTTTIHYNSTGVDDVHDD